MPTDRKVFMAVVSALVLVTGAAKGVSPRTQVGGGPRGMRAVCQKCPNLQGASLGGHSRHDRGPQDRDQRRRQVEHARAPDDAGLEPRPSPSSKLSSW